MNDYRRFKVVLTTLLAIAGVIVLIRLGIWQLDRLKWRRTFNSHYLQQVAMPALFLNESVEDPVLIDSEYRQVRAKGHYDFGGEVYLQNQAFQNQPGFRALTPYVLDGSEMVVYVDRGWIGMDAIETMDEINQNAEGEQEISGVIRLPQQRNSFGIDPDAEKSPDSRFWMIVNLERLQERERRTVLPIYIQLTKKETSNLPIPVPNEIEISEGPHMGYAIQWFFFATLLAGGYPFFLRKILNTPSKRKEIVDDDY